ncbi:cytochrome P450 oxidoreductase [Halenospora varia]|nr:cytochrome P450 oxidoreductase [Halenospora varia]
MFLLTPLLEVLKTPVYYPLGFGIFCVVWVIYQRFFSPLADVPGPFWASITRFWYFNRAAAEDMHRYTKELHKKYGPLVRIAPDEVSCSEPAAMKTIYAVNAGYTKTDFYLTQAPNMSPHGDSFSQQDEKKHTFRRRMINNIFTINSVLESEPYIDSVTEAFLKRMAEFADSNTVVDMSEWLHMYTFDVIGELFFGRMFGFIHSGKDVGGYIGAVDTILPHAIKMAVIPIWQRPFQIFMIPFSAKFRGAITKFNALAAASKQYVDERVNGKSDRTDMLEKLLGVMKEKSPDFDITDVYTESYTAIFAGSDTTAIALRSAIYHLCKNPKIYAKLQAEIDSFQKEGKLSEHITYAEAMKMPYTCATVKEAMRVHPSIALTFPRHVPRGGAMISGKYFPEGYRVGVNPYVLHYQPSIFGHDAEDFNPDRWFRPDAAVMDRYMFQFGSGTRGCIGKNVALAELHKFLPEFLRSFNVELVDPTKEWKEHNTWFVKQTDIDCRVSKRTV